MKASINLHLEGREAEIDARGREDYIALDLDGDGSQAAIYLSEEQASIVILKLSGAVKQHRILAEAKRAALNATGMS